MDSSACLHPTPHCPSPSCGLEIAPTGNLFHPSKLRGFSRTAPPPAERKRGEVKRRGGRKRREIKEEFVLEALPLSWSRRAVSGRGQPEPEPEPPDAVAATRR